MALKFTKLEDGREELINQDTTCTGLIRCNGTTMPAGYMRIAEDILHMEVREDDTWVCTFPKSGTTWTEELVWCIANDLDFQAAMVSQMIRFPYLEVEQSFRGKQVNLDTAELELDPRIFTHSFDYVKEMKSPRFIKTHLPFNLLPLQIQRGEVKPKIIHVSRNPMDTCISFFHHQVLLGFTGTLEDFATLFINNAVIYTPYWSHYLSYVQKKEKCKILYLKYEEMKKDLPSVIRKTMEFYGKSLTDEEVEKLGHHLSFNNMKNNKATNLEDVVRYIQNMNGVEVDGKFLREGTVGQWRHRFSSEWIQRFRKWTEANIMGTDLWKPLEHYGFGEED